MNANNAIRFVLTLFLFSYIFEPAIILADGKGQRPLANTLTLESTTPVEGAVNVPVTGPFSFTFSEPIDESAVFEDFFLGLALYPEETYTDDESINFSADKKTVTFTGLTLQENTQYLVVLTGARSTTGNTLDKPYVLHFSTGPTLGQYTVSGQVSSKITPVENSVVLLAKLDEDGLWMYNGTVVDNAQGNYTIPFVEEDSYVLVAGVDSNGDGLIDPFTGDNSGWYDANGDAWPDEITAAGNVTGIDIVINTAAMTTAGEMVPQIETVMKDTDPAAYLVMIMGEDITTKGKAPGWYYVYYSPLLNVAAYIMVIGHVIMDGGFENTELVPNPVPESWLDSDQIMALAEAAGGTAFRAVHADAYISMSLGPEDEYNPQNSRIIWRVYYESELTGDFFYAAFDPVTGTNLTGVKDNPVAKPDQIGVTPNFPNPFNPSTTIIYTLPKQGHVRIRILDVQGREVAILVNHVQIAGQYQISWNGFSQDGEVVASGIYFCEIVFGQTRRFNRMLLMR